jgi:quinolinate synthase
MNLRDEIAVLKTKRKAVILAHNYQRPEIQEVADFIGDSLDLSLKARETDAAVIVFCGVDFMAETAKILSPEKTVLMPVRDATCPMAHQLTTEMIVAAKKAHPEAQVVLYINSTAEAKALADAICTSANAVHVVRSLPAGDIIFGPDCNLASYVQALVPEKRIIPIPPGGHCYVHEMFDRKDVDEARKRGGMIICHPECRPEVRAGADVIASTGGMVRAAPEARVWNVFTEREMSYRLKTLYPDKTFHAKEESVCTDMKKTRLMDLYLSLRDLRYEVIVDPEIMEGARQALEKMIRTGR